MLESSSTCLRMQPGPKQSWLMRRSGAAASFDNADGFYAAWNGMSAVLKAALIYS